MLQNTAHLPKMRTNPTNSLRATFDQLQTRRVDKSHPVDIMYRSIARWQVSVTCGDTSWIVMVSLAGNALGTPSLLIFREGGREGEGKRGSKSKQP